MVKEKYREIVAVETGAVPGKESGYYYYDSRPNTPNDLLFQPTTSKKAYEQSRTKGTPTAGAFFGKGTGAPGYYTADKQGGKKYNPGGEGRFQVLDYTRDKVTPQQIAQAQFQQMSLEDQKQKIISGLTPVQKSALTVGTASLTHRPGGYAPPTNLFGEYGIRGSGPGAYTPESWLFSQTQKGLAQQLRENRLMSELGESSGYFDPFAAAERVLRSPGSDYESSLIRQEAPTGYEVPVWGVPKSAQIQYEADAIPIWEPVAPVPTALELLLDTGPTRRPSSLKPLGPYGPFIPDVDQLRSNLSAFSQAYHQWKDPINPWQSLADRLYPRTGTTLAEWEASGLGSPYENPLQGIDSIHGPIGFLEALTEYHGISTPGPSTYDPLYDRFTYQRLIDNERALLEGTKAAANLLDIPGGVEFVLGVSQVPGEIWRGGLSKEEYEKLRAEEKVQYPTFLERSTYQLGRPNPDFYDRRYDVDRAGAAIAIGAGLKDWAYGWPDQLRAAYGRDPALFGAQLMGELAAYPIIAQKLARGGKLSQTLGKGFEFFTEPGEAALEAALNLKYPGLAARFGGSLGFEELALQAMLGTGRLTQRGLQRIGVELDDYILRSHTPRIVSEGSFIEMTRPGDGMVTIPTEVDINGYPLLFGTEMGTGMHYRVEEPPLLMNPRTGEIYPVDELTPKDISRSDRAMDALERRKSRLRDIQRRKDLRSEYVDVYDDYIQAKQDEWVDVKDMAIIDSLRDYYAQNPARITGGVIQNPTAGEISEWDMKAKKAVWEAEMAFKDQMIQEMESIHAVHGITSPRSGRLAREASRIRKGEAIVPLRLPPDFLSAYKSDPKWKKQMMFDIDRLPQGFAMMGWDLGYPIPPLRMSDYGKLLREAEIQYIKSADALTPYAEVRGQELTDWLDEPLFPDVETWQEFAYEVPTIDSRVIKGKQPDLDWMQRQIITPQQLTEQRMRQMEDVRNPFTYMGDPALRFDLPTSTDPTISRVDMDYLPPGVIDTPFGPTQIPVSITGQPTAVGVDEAFEQAHKFDQAQMQKVEEKLKAPSRLRRRLKLDLKRRKIEEKRKNAARKKAERTRRKFLFDLFKDEIAIPEVIIPQVNIPQVNIPQVNIPQVNIPQVNIPQVRIPQVHVPQVRVPQVRVPQVHVPEVHVPEVTDTQVEVPKVHIPQVEIYK